MRSNWNFYEFRVNLEIWVSSIKISEESGMGEKIMLINLESHINMLHTQSDEKWREQGEKMKNCKMIVDHHEVRSMWT